jgi:RimJ/RimL family protein N-acetyltransferase
MDDPEIQLKVVDMLGDAERTETIRALTGLQASAGEQSFVQSPAEIVHQSLADTSRRLFAIVLDGESGTSEVVGVGVLHPDGADRDTWPSGLAHVFLRGFLVDRRYRSQGVARASLEASVSLARDVHPTAMSLLLRVHADNHTARRVFRRAGFRATGVRVPGREGLEDVMALDLSGDVATQ